MACHRLFALMVSGRANGSILPTYSMEVEMSAKLSWNPKLLMVVALAAIVLFSTAIPVRATPGSGVTGELLASGTLTEDVPSKFKTEPVMVQADGAKIDVSRYTTTPGGGLGWHEHGGRIWATVV